MDVSSQLPLINATQPGSTVNFKGLALFTPGGDCVYCVDQQKREHWHLDLCAALQKALCLTEPPYFLLPCYTATLDRWVDATSQKVITVAEAYPRALRFQPLLNALFGTLNLQWQPNYAHSENCSIWIIESYRRLFPQLWECHDLIMPVMTSNTSDELRLKASDLEFEYAKSEARLLPYLFKLFVSGADTLATEQMLRVLHNTFELALPGAYTLQLIDVLKHPDAAEAEHITATPTLIQVSPPPTRRIVGRLPNQDQIKELLGQQ